MRILPSERNTDFSTGAVRGESVDRGQPSLLPFSALRLLGRAFKGAHSMPWHGIIEVSKVYEAGARKYDARNWEKGIPLSRYVDSADRHLDKFLLGRTDEPHLGQFAWNLLGLLQTTLWVADKTLPSEINDLPSVTLEPGCKAEITPCGRLSTELDVCLNTKLAFLCGEGLNYLVMSVGHSLVALQQYQLVREGDVHRGYVDIPRIYNAIKNEQKTENPE